MPIYAVVPNQSESLHALTVPQHRTASVLGLPVSKYCTFCRGRFSHQFWSSAVHESQGIRQSQKEGSFFTPIWYALLENFVVLLYLPHPSWKPFLSFIHSTTDTKCSYALDLSMKNGVIQSSATSGNITTMRESSQRPSHHLYFTPWPVSVVNRDTNPADWCDPVQEKVAGFLKHTFLSFPDIDNLREGRQSCFEGWEMVVT